MKTYVILGAGGSFGIHTAFYLLAHADPKKVIGIGRNPLRPEPFSLNIDRQPRYEYHTRHLTYELVLLLEVLDREDDPIRPSSPYAASKAAFDWYLISVHRFLKFPMNIIRPSNAYGPGQLLHRVIPKAVVCGLKGEKLPLHGGGRAEKSYIHARDLGRAVHLVAERAPPGAVYNCGPDEPTSIRRVVELTAEALGVPFDRLCEMSDDRLGQDSRYWLDSSAIKRDVGWEPRIDWTEGLHEMAAWGRKYFDALKDWPTDYVMRG